MTTTKPADAVVQTLTTPDGPFTILVRADGTVLASGWTTGADEVLARLSPAARPSATRPGRTAAADRVVAYYDGELHALDDAPLAQLTDATTSAPFLRAAWRALRAVRPGHPVTYTELAAASGRPRAVRAAASACARNPAALFVPCHRVLRSDGSLGGFAWGLSVKAALLARESNA
ncbi:MAG: methylated-DNA--[protein]-cysteine S-methyltransferase [Cellulomonadaceae bacterium]